jgi:predicted nuclease with RNAse H fold
LLAQHRGAVSIGVDAPLGFPRAFHQLMRGEVLDFNLLQKQAYQPMAWRYTDLYVRERYKSPLSPTFSFLTSNATLAISLLRALKQEGFPLAVLPFDEESRIVAMETYPSLLKSGWPSMQRYWHIIEALHLHQSEGASYYRGEAPDKTDSFDALICALFALSWFEVPELPVLEKRLPQEQHALILEEGWVYFPQPE